MPFGTAAGRPPCASTVGIEICPYRWNDDRAETHAQAVRATLARGRSHGGISLSPASIRASAGVERLVLPSPNGSTIAFALQQGGLRVVSACLRNAGAVGRWVANQLASEQAASVIVVAAGERWPDGSLRPAVEDHWGAGAVISTILSMAHLSSSVEARSAAAAFTSAAAELETALRSCTSGRELIDYGFADDVTIAAELVPLPATLAL